MKSNEPIPNRWAVTVEGDAIDLQNCENLFTGNSAGCIRKLKFAMPDLRWALTAQAFEKFEDESEVLAEAQTILRVINGLLFAYDASSNPIMLAGTVHKQASNGNWGVAIFVPSMSATARSGSYLVSPSDGVSEQATLLNAILENADLIRSALGHLADQPGWFEIYKALECLEEFMEVNDSY